MDHSGKTALPKRRKCMSLLINKDFFEAMFPHVDVAHGKTFRQRFMEDEMYKTKDGIQYFVCTPGVAKEDIEVTVKNNILNIKATRRFDGQPVSNLSRSFELDNDLDTLNITSKYNNGLLNINIPYKQKKDTVQNITIQ